MAGDELSCQIPYSREDKFDQMPNTWPASSPLGLNIDRCKKQICDVLGDFDGVNYVAHVNNQQS